MAEQISDLIVDILAEELETGLSDSALPEEEKIGVARGGKLQDNPVKARLYVLLHINDPDSDSWADIPTSAEGSNMARSEFYAPAYEIGGGGLWWRRFTIEFGLFAIKTKEDREEARRIANAIKGRIEKLSALSAGVPGLRDDFGESAIKVVLASSRIEEGTARPY
jgi:hypothetical protein